MLTEIAKKERRERGLAWRQRRIDLIVGVSAGVAAAHDKDAARQANDLIEELAGWDPEEEEGDETSTDAWLTNPDAKGYDLDDLRSQMAGLGQRTARGVAVEGPPVSLSVIPSEPNSEEAERT